MTITRAPQSWTSAGMEASGCLARARMLLTARLAIPSLASTVALPMCGKMTRLGQVSRGLEGGRGSGVQTSSPAPAQLCLLRRLERGGRGGHTFYTASVEGRDQRLLVHQASPGDVDEEGGALHVPEELRTDDLVGLLAETGGHHHDVRHCCQLGETNPGNLGQQPETQLSRAAPQTRAPSYLAASVLSLLLE